jgi:hypothetical protein
MKFNDLLIAYLIIKYSIVCLIFYKIHKKYPFENDSFQEKSCNTQD